MTQITTEGAQRTVEEVARTSYGRLLAYLCARCGNVTGAEDALGEAFYRALRDWPESGLPINPEAWLLRVAYNHLIDEARKRQVRSRAEGDLIRAAEEAQRAFRDEVFPDERLKLLFVCAHPAIDPAMRTPLMLQLVLGFDAARIGSAFLIAPTTMGQRLVRVKTKIREARLSFDIPDPVERAERLESVLEAIYAVYGQGWDDPLAASHRGFVDEALYLAHLMVQFLPEEPETRGLLALILYCESRREARRAPNGGFIPLSEQDPGRWSRAMIDAAEEQLRTAAGFGRPGRFQCEAAIQSAHVARMTTGDAGPETIAHLYDALIRYAPTVGAFVGHAAAVAEWQGPDAGLALLDALDPAVVKGYQSYWATRAHLLQQAGRTAEARPAFDLAIGLSEDISVQRFLLARKPPA